MESDGDERKRERERRGGRKTRHQGRVILAPRHVTPVVDRHLGHSTKATTGDEASSTAIKARLVASHRSISRTVSSFWSRSAVTYIDILSPANHVLREIALRRNCIESDNILRDAGENARR